MLSARRHNDPQPARSTAMTSAACCRETLRPAVAMLLAGILSGILSGILGVASAGAARGEERADAAMAERIQTLIPALEAYVENGMKAFDVPGLAIGIVANDRLVYGKGFGVRAKGGAAVDPGTVFQIASVAKGFLAATLAIMVDRGKLNWDDRVIDRDAE